MRGKVYIVIIIFILILGINVDSSMKIQAQGIDDTNTNDQNVLDNLFVVDRNTSFNANNYITEEMLDEDYEISSSKEKEPKILIFHSHSQEAYIDNKNVIGVGEELKKQLEDKYGVNVLHCKNEFDVLNGKINRVNSYERAEEVIKDILKDNPSIEVLIDIQRDGVIPSFEKEIVMINKKPSAKIFCVNGISSKVVDGKQVKLENYPNKYVNDNLCFSTKIKLNADNLYPEFMKKIIIKPFRYSTHMMPKSLLIEVGNNRNSLEEAQNSMEPLADILMEVTNYNKN